MHLRGCKPRFHLRGWTPKIQNNGPSNTSYQHTHLPTRIGDNKHLIGELSHHHHMAWFDAELGNITCLKT
jgi:hypothetical protein